jgi:hypothetical protein
MVGPAVPLQDSIRDELGLDIKTFLRGEMALRASVDDEVSL